MSFSLTKGSLKKILEGSNVTDPIMQILSIKSIQNNNVDQTTRYKITLFDGDIQHTFGILATQKNNLIDDNELHVGSVVRLTEYAANVLSKEPSKVVIILMNFDILGDMEVRTGNDQQQQKPTKTNNENQEPIKQTSNNYGSSNKSYNSNTSPVKQNTNNSAAANAASNSVSTSSSSAGINSNKFFKQESLKQPKKAISSDNSTQSSSSSSGGMFCNFKIFSISSLNPYQNKWAVKVRVTNKSPIKTWSNSKGEGKLFSVDLIDQSGEMRATGFNDVCDKYYDLLQIDHVYHITKAQLKTANKQYSTIDNDYEMTFSNETIIEQCDTSDDADNAIPHIKLQLIPLSDILNKSANDIVDVIGIVRSTNDVQTIITKQTNKELKKREVQIVDSSNCAVSCTFWGKQAEDFDGRDNPVVLLKGVKVSEFNGKQLSVMGSTLVQINPDISEAHTLRGWYDQGGASNADIQDISSNPNGGGMGGGSMTQSTWKTFDQIKDEQLGMNDKPDYFSSTASVLLARKENALYMACPTDNCNKKVIDQNNGFYRCEKCGKDFDTFKWRMILNLNIGDHTESQWVTCFQDTGEFILGIKSQDLGDLKSSNQAKYDEYFENCVFKQFNFKLRAKMETYNDERRVKVSVTNTDPVDYVAGGRRLLQKIKSYLSANN